MKKYFILSTSLILFNGIVAQNSEHLNANNVDAILNDNGIFFNDDANSAGYEIPAGSGNHVTYATAFWMAATDLSSNLHTACNKYGSGEDFFPGPIANDYNSSYYTSTYASAIWKVTRDQINYHVSNYGATGYVPDAAISNWPGNGNTSEGIAAQLAPYVDANGDNIYDPMDGDFPYIQGDAAVYIIMNDVAGIHTQTYGQPIGVEVHAVFYQFESTDALNNTTFLNVRIYNRGTVSYDDFKFGLFMDTDIGNSNDDYIGCDSTRNLAYGYNGDNTDEGGSGQPGYGNNPPAFGAKFLNETAGAVMYFNGGGGMMGEPNNASDYNYYMQANFLNGAPLMNGTSPTNFIYSGNPFTNTGWTEPGTGNPPQDRRILISSTEKQIGAGEELCFDIAFVYGQNTVVSGGDTTVNLTNVGELLNVADFVQNYYDNDIQPCNQIFLANGPAKQTPAFAVYPNPSTGIFTINTDELLLLSVYDLSGKLIQGDTPINQSGPFSIELNNGIYLFEFTTATGVFYERIEIQK